MKQVGGGQIFTAIQTYRYHLPVPRAHLECLNIANLRMTLIEDVTSASECMKAQ